MTIKPVFLFIGGCLMVLFSLDALAKEAPSSNVLVETTEKAIVADIQEEQKAGNAKEVGACRESKKPSKQLAVNPSAEPNSALNRSNLSFNFVYYILYKFKYIDVYHLFPSPASSGNEEQLLKLR